MTEISEMEQGAITTEKPFTMLLGVHEIMIMFRKEVFLCVGGVRSDEVQSVTNSLNEAFQKGFADAAEKLLNKGC